MKSYISKINDRNLQRKRESGITTYALFSVLVVILYKIIEFYPTLPLKDQHWEVFFIITYSFNIFLCLVLIYAIYGDSFKHISSIRVVSKSSEKESLLENIIDSSTLFIPLGANLLSFSYKYFSLNIFDWYYFIFLIIYLLIGIFIIIGLFKERKIKKSYEIFEGTGKCSSDKNLVSFIGYLIIIIAICFSINFLFNTKDDLNTLQIFVFGLLIFSIPFILTKIISLRKNDSFAEAMENLEYEINVRKLTDDEIIERIQKNYMGFLLIDWIDYKQKELHSFKSKLAVDQKTLVSMHADLKKLDSIKYPIEHNGRKDKVSNFEKKINHEISHYFQNNLKEIERIWDDSKLDNNEREELRKFYFVLVDEYKPYKEKNSH